MTSAQTLRDQTNDVADRTTQRISEAANSAGAAIRDATHKVTAGASDLGERATTASHDLSRRVEQQPLTSVMVAAGVGFVVGLLFARR